MPDQNYFANLIWQIADHIARETAKLDTVQIASERNITLLKERYVVLVTAACNPSQLVTPPRQF